ncbi:MAG TPA: hypothetical protein VHK27_07720, partial [Gammaproteobacteria bacterium]|nr:hypothetical protein [Gammaproteobacteria bacterium]
MGAAEHQELAHSGESTRRLSVPTPQPGVLDPGVEGGEAARRRLDAAVASPGSTPASGPPLRPRDLLAMQRSLGNRGVQHLLARRVTNRPAAGGVVPVETDRAAGAAISPTGEMVQRLTAADLPALGAGDLHQRFEQAQQGAAPPAPLGTRGAAPAAQHQRAPDRVGATT